MTDKILPFLLGSAFLAASSLAGQVQFTTDDDVLGINPSGNTDETLGWTSFQMAADDDWSSSTWRGWSDALIDRFDPDSFTLLAITEDRGHDSMWTWATKSFDISSFPAGQEIVITGTARSVVYEGLLSQLSRVSATVAPDTTDDFRTDLSIVNEASFPTVNFDEPATPFELRGIIPEGTKYLRLVFEIILDKVVEGPTFDVDGYSYGEAELTVYNLTGTIGPATVAETWHGYEIVEGAGGLDWANAEDWLGWVMVENAPFYYCLSLDSWFYMDADESTNGAWIYMFRN